MKTRFSRVRGLSLLLTAVAAIISTVAHGVAALNPHGMSNILGVAYDRINATTVSDLTTMTSKAREELWCRRIIFGADRLYQDNPFADMTGGPGQGRCVTSITETNKVAGNTVNIPLLAGLGGPGVSGNGDRISKEQKLRISNFSVQIGRFWFGFGIDSIAKEETVIGGLVDNFVTTALKQQMAKKKSDDILMKLRQRLDNSRNLVFPDGIASIAALTSAKTMSTALISKAGTALSSLGAAPMAIGKDPSGSYIEQFVLLATHHSLSPLDTESAYLDGRLNADVRGPNNAIWRGIYQDWNGHAIYRWYQRDHANYGPVGSPLCPRAFLGEAITNATTSTVVKGGGSAAAAAVTPAPAYFEFFRNAPYTYFNGETIAADTSTTRHLMIINPSGSYGVFPYQVNNGNTITISGVAVAIGVGTETDDFVEGALIVECNILGVPFGYSLMLGADAVVSGTGTINGSKVDPQFGKRTEEHRNHDMDHAIGLEGVWGCEVVKRTDNVYPNAALVCHATPVAGAPTVTS